MEIKLINKNDIPTLAKVMAASYSEEPWNRKAAAGRVREKT